MRLNESNLEQLFLGRTFKIPIFQRHYEWTKDNWDDLIGSIEEISSNYLLRYSDVFLGTIIISPEDSFAQVYHIVDGQQRLVTLSILLAAIRDLNENFPSIVNSIQSLLLKNNEDFKKDVINNTRFELSYRDKINFCKIINNPGILDNYNLIDQCYNYFFDYYQNLFGNVDYEKLLYGINRHLKFAALTIEDKDDPGQIFNTVNSSGKDLDDIDLIRNYIFIKIHESKRAKLYQFWSDVEKGFGCSEDFLYFIRDLLISKGEEVPQSVIGGRNKARIFKAFTQSMKYNSKAEHEEQLGKFITRMHSIWEIYSTLLKPYSRFSLDPKIQRILFRLNIINLPHFYPLLILAFEKKNILGSPSIEDINEIRDILNMIENYYVRNFVCMESLILSKKFQKICSRIQSNPEKSLKKIVKDELCEKLPKDYEFVMNLIDSQLYGRGSYQFIKLILIALEDYITKQHHIMPFDADKLSIEHILPVHPKEKWKEDLGKEYEDTLSTLCHTLGNLTLLLGTVNQEISNSSFDTKKELIFKDTKYAIHDPIKNAEKWGKKEIISRAENYANICITIWPYFGIIDESLDYKIPLADDKPVNIRIKNIICEVNDWEEVLSKTLEAMESINPKQFSKIIEDKPNLLSYDPKSFKKCRCTKNKKIYFDLPNRGKATVKRCNDFCRDMGWVKSDWEGECLNKDGVLFKFR